jgi:hypothetical protein
MVIEAALPAAERQQVGILDKRLLQTLAEAFSIKAGPPRFDTKRWLDAMTTSFHFNRRLVPLHRADAICAPTSPAVLRIRKTVLSRHRLHLRL